MLCQRKIYYATRLLCFPIYGTPNDTDAVHIMILHDTANVCLLEKPNVMGKLPSFCQPTANVHAIITLPSRLQNSVSKFFTHSFAADVGSLPRCWQEVQNELQCRLFSIHPLHDATMASYAPRPLRSTYLWQQIFLVIRIMESQAQQQKTKHPLSRSSRISELAFKKRRKV